MRPSLLIIKECTNPWRLILLIVTLTLLDDCYSGGPFTGSHNCVTISTRWLTPKGKVRRSQEEELFMNFAFFGLYSK
jgi:hypothetical protein